MKAILSHQNPINGQDDIVVINGISQQYTRTEEQQRAYSLLTVSPDQLFKIPFGMSNNSVSNTFKMFVKDNGIVLISNFENVDQVNRRIGYTFYVDSSVNSLEAVNLLQNYSAIAGMNLNTSDVELYKKMFDLHSNHPTIVKTSSFSKIAIAGAIILVLVFALSKCNQSDNKVKPNEKEVKTDSTGVSR